jgi:hypothetical protein
LQLLGQLLLKLLLLRVHLQTLLLLRAPLRGTGLLVVSP